jgi:hypothetical protein
VEISKCNNEHCVTGKISQSEKSVNIFPI